MNGERYFYWRSVASAGWTRTVITFTSSQTHMKKMNITNRLQKRLGKRMHEAFTFLVAAAWAELFNDIFVMITGDNTHIFMRLLHAIVFTLLALLVTILVEGDATTGGLRCSRSA